MNGQIISAIIFVFLMMAFIFIKRKHIKVEGKPPIAYQVSYRTKLGLKLMDWLASRFPRFWNFFGFASITIGFIGMIIVTAYLVYSFVNIVMASGPVAMQGAALVLPFKIKGVFYVPFTYWLISLLIIIAMHELAHGILSRRYDIKVKSSGFAFLGLILPLIPAAFVEPDEKIVAKKPRKQQLAMFSAGASINILFAFFVLIVLIPILYLATSHILVNDGVEVTSLLSEKYGPNPAKEAGIEVGDVIQGMEWKWSQIGNAVHESEIETQNDLIQELSWMMPGEVIKLDLLHTDGTRTYKELVLATHPYDKDNPYMGIETQQHTRFADGVKERYGALMLNVALWLSSLLYWLYVLSLGIGLMNLVPILPFDGGRMMYTALGKFIGDKAAKGITVFFTITLGLMLIIMVVLAFVR